MSSMSLICSQSIGAISARFMWSDIWYYNSKGGQDCEFFPFVSLLDPSSCCMEFGHSFSFDQCKREEQVIENIYECIALLDYHEKEA